MLRIFGGIFVILHGLVHLWYFILSQRLVEFKPDMGWSGESWIFTPLLGDTTTRVLASVFYILSALAFVVSGFGIFIQSGWWRSVLMVAALVSSATIILFWDGKAAMLVQKGILGLAINLVILIALLVNLI